MRIVRVINATSSSLSGKFVLIYLVLLLFNRLLPAKTVTVSTQTSRLGKFSYFGPLDILDVIPPSLDLITFENIVISRGTLFLCDIVVFNRGKSDADMNSPEHVNITCIICNLHRTERNKALIATQRREEVPGIYFLV